MVFVYIAAIAVLLTILGLGTYNLVLTIRLHKFLNKQVIAYQVHTDFAKCMTCSSMVARYFRHPSTKKVTCANCDHEGYVKSGGK